jgi:conjugative transfer signal peptidase TraF
MTGRPTRTVVGLAWGSLALLAFASSAGLHVNRTVSMPIGVWRSHPTIGPLTAGDVVAVCLPPTELIRRYVGPGSCATGTEPLLKTIGAVEGDTVVLDAFGASVNGVPIPNTAALSADTAGRLLPAFPAGTYRVRRGQVFLFSSHDPRCFDSRYFGPVETSQVVAIATPVLTFN